MPAELLGIILRQWPLPGARIGSHCRVQLEHILKLLSLEHLLSPFLDTFIPACDLRSVATQDIESHNSIELFLAGLDSGLVADLVIQRRVLQPNLAPHELILLVRLLDRSLPPFLHLLVDQMLGYLSIWPQKGFVLLDRGQLLLQGFESGVGRCERQDGVGRLGEGDTDAELLGQGQGALPDLGY
jgi:hypothetical protein